MREVVRRSVNLGPAHARNPVGLDSHGSARQDPEALDAAVLLRPFERKLEPEADPEHRTIGGHTCAQHLVEPLPAQLVHRRPGRADAGQNREVGSRDIVDELGAEPPKRDLDRPDVPGAVVAHGDPHRLPFVDGIPLDSTRSAVRSARPTALYAASATWCASRPEAST